jgi:hypothetical protein
MQLREGLHFILSDLRVAMVWATTHASVRVLVVADHFYLPELIEVFQPGAVSPRWCMWRDHLGRLHLDDEENAEFDLPFHTVERALAFIASQLGEWPS